MVKHVIFVDKEHLLHVDRRAMLHSVEVTDPKESDKKPPRSASRKAVPMKFVTMMAERDREKCMYFDR